MIPYILGGVALAVTGLGVKKYLEDEDNCKKVEDTFCDWINKVDEATDVFFDYANEKIDELDKRRNGSSNNNDDDFEDESELESKSNSTPLLFGGKVTNFLAPNIEEDRESDKVIENETIYEFEKVLSNLYATSLKDLKIAFDEIDNLPRKIEISNYQVDNSKYNFININDEIIENFNKYIKIINETRIYLENQLDIIDTIIISSDDFLSYGEEDKKIIENLMNLCDTINNINGSEIIINSGNISREVKRAFAKLEGIIV
jgi:hypothetical protein